MKKGQQGVGLVILGVIAIIAVIGLVLLFTRASQPAQGALLTDLSIGNVYGGGPKYGAEGIANTYQTQAYLPGVPQIAYPAYQPYPGGVSTRGARTPAFIVSGKYAYGGFASLEDVYGCERDLTVGAKIGVPHDQFNCYAVPNKAGSMAQGFYPPASAAQARPDQDYTGKLGGDMYCYANSLGAEQQVPNAEDKVRENILIQVVRNPTGMEKFDWTTVMVNGKEVPVCWVSAKTFPFNQGLDAE
jgi:hypothetical protein